MFDFVLNNEQEDVDPLLLTILTTPVLREDGHPLPANPAPRLRLGVAGLAKEEAGGSQGATFGKVIGQSTCPSHVCHLQDDQHDAVRGPGQERRRQLAPTHADGAGGALLHSY